MAEPPPVPQANAVAKSTSMTPAAQAPPRPVWREFHVKVLAVIFFMALMGFLLAQVPWATDTTTESQQQTTPPLAELMFGGFGASFVLLSLVMGGAIIGGLFLAKEDPSEDGSAKYGARGGQGAPLQAKGGDAVADEDWEEEDGGGGGRGPAGGGGGAA